MYNNNVQQHISQTQKVTIMYTLYETGKGNTTLIADAIAARKGLTLNDNAGETLTVEAIAMGTLDELWDKVKGLYDKEQELFEDVRMTESSTILCDYAVPTAMVFSDGTTTWWIAKDIQSLEDGWLDYLLD